MCIRAVIERRTARLHMPPSCSCMVRQSNERRGRCRPRSFRSVRARGNRSRCSSRLRGDSWHRSYIPRLVHPRRTHTRPACCRSGSQSCTTSCWVHTRLPHMRPCASSLRSAYPRRIEPERSCGAHLPTWTRRPSVRCSSMRTRRCRTPKKPRKRRKMLIECSWKPSQ